jgi:hypothetical protein
MCWEVRSEYTKTREAGRAGLRTIASKQTLDDYQIQEHVIHNYIDGINMRQRQLMRKPSIRKQTLMVA